MDKHQEITVCAFLYNEKGELFIARRASTKSFLPNTYELVGGHVEFGETLQGSIVRELKEEIEIDVIVEEPFYAFTYTSNNDSTHTIEVDYFAKLPNYDQSIIINPEDHSEYKWINEFEVDEYFENDDEEKKAVMMGFKKLKEKL